MKYFTSVVVVPVVVLVAVLIGWVIHRDQFEQYVPYYVLGGAIIGIVLSILFGSDKALPEGREHGDYIETIARRDAHAAAFRDLLITLLVSAVVFTVANTNTHLNVFISSVTALALLDVGIRQRRLYVQYAP